MKENKKLTKAGENLPLTLAQPFALDTVISSK